MSDYGPSVKVCKVYEKTSKAGNQYFVGRWGAARINILRSRETSNSGEAIWEVLLQEAPPAQKAERSGTRRETIAEPEHANEMSEPAMSDDPVPF